MMAEMNTDRLAELIGKKHACLLQLRDFGRRQDELVDGEDVALLLKLLASKQHLISNLQNIEQDLAPFREQDPERRPWRCAEDRSRCAHVAAECQQLLGEIVQQEKASEDRLKKRRDEVKARLTIAQAAAQVRGAYRPEMARSSAVLDIASEA
jgi:hypothetical protein